MSDSSHPLVYSCSGCSNVAQLANTLALRLDRSGLAEMSCIAGVGGHVAALVNKARSGRRILALDGCPLQCVKSCLDQHDLHADVHLIVSHHGLRKRNGEDCTEEQSDELFEEIKRLIESRKIEATEPA
ncbi:putative zinc-binding protein [Pseudomonas sp. ABY48]|uniref:putative zinc-binding protein n=1 Tax=Pseudomonas sp. ABY48 TaxID=3402865 RepID=UPI003B431629